MRYKERHEFTCACCGTIYDAADLAEGCWQRHVQAFDDLGIAFTVGQRIVHHGDGRAIVPTYTTSTFHIIDLRGERWQQCALIEQRGGTDDVDRGLAGTRWWAHLIWQDMLQWSTNQFHPRVQVVDAE